MDTDFDRLATAVEESRRTIVFLGSGFGPAGRPGMTKGKITG